MKVTLITISYPASLTLKMKKKEHVEMLCLNMSVISI